MHSPGYRRTFQIGSIKTPDKSRMMLTNEDTSPSFSCSLIYRCMLRTGPVTPFHTFTDNNDNKYSVFIIELINLSFFFVLFKKILFYLFRSKNNRYKKKEITKITFIKKKIDNPRKHQISLN